VQIKIYCETCKSPIGIIDPETFKEPIVGGMIGSLMPDHKIPPLFPAECLWENLKCPYCNYRPFEERGRAMTHPCAISFFKALENSEANKLVVLAPDGKSVISVKPKFICLICGRGIKTKTALLNHERACRKKNG